MKIVEAVWDTRTLGVRCLELNFEAGECLSCISEIDKATDGFKYIVAKVPSGRVDLLLALQAKGYSFIECSIEMAVDLSTIEVPRFVARFEPFIHSIEATTESAERIYAKLREGVFDSDRIYLDPFFSKDLAAQRYINWIDDEIERGGKLYHVYYKDEEVGFFANKEISSGKEIYPFLTGLYSEFKDSGLGSNVISLEPMREAERQGYKRVRSWLSSNNLPCLKINQSLGHKVVDMQYVLTLHQTS